MLPAVLPAGPAGPHARPVLSVRAPSFGQAFTETRHQPARASLVSPKMAFVRSFLSSVFLQHHFSGNAAAMVVTTFNNYTGNPVSPECSPGPRHPALTLQRRPLLFLKDTVLQSRNLLRMSASSLSQARCSPCWAEGSPGLLVQPLHLNVQAQPERW